MRRILGIGLVAVWFIIPNVYAIPSEGIVLPEAGAWVWGMQGNYIAARDFNKMEGRGSTAQSFIQLAYAWNSWFSFDGKIGSGDIVFRRTDGIQQNFPAGFSGGYGFRCKIFSDQPGRLSVVGGFQHISCHPFKELRGEQEYRVIWDEWQGTVLFGAALSEAWAVYAGPQYSAVQLKYTVDDFRRRLKGEDTWGIVAGARYLVNAGTAVTLEVRGAAETAMNAGILSRF
ncbi:MAG: hypothetical protein NC924_07085 [Candidatus Omnitrophica bacterium]|nr:hypothetical protein [Candidatus Omnitrophota bacterium]